MEEVRLIDLMGDSWELSIASDTYGQYGTSTKQTDLSVVKPEHSCFHIFSAMNARQFFNELKRRNVYRVSVSYAIVAWLLVQVASIVLPTFQAPDWVMKVFMLALLIGFPVALILAWAFEMSPSGMVRTTSEEANDNPLPKTKRKPLTSNLLIGFLLLIIVGQFVYNQFLQPGIDTSQIEKSIAVLPFSNESSNQENQYFCNGVMEGILDHLAKIPELTVISRSSVEQYRDDRPTAKEIASKLDVQYLVDGSVQRMGDKAVIFARLIYAQEDKHLWSKRYDRSLRDLFAIQAEITESIAGELKAIIAPDIKRRIESVPTTDPLAYDYYLQGREKLLEADSHVQSNENWNDHLDKAQLSFELALEKDSVFAEAVLGLASVDFIRNVDVSVLDVDYLGNTLELSNKALAINDQLAEAYVLRSEILLRNKKLDLAEPDMEMALQLNPNSVKALYHAAYYKSYVDLDFRRAIELYKQIEQRISSLDEIVKLYEAYSRLVSQFGDLPLTETIEDRLEKYQPKYSMIKMSIYQISGRTDENEEYINRYMPEENQSKLIELAENYLHSGKYEKSIEYYERWETLLREESVDNWLSTNDWHRYGQALVLGGHEERGRLLLNKQIEINNTKLALGRFDVFYAFAPIYDLAGIHAFLGDKEKAYYWLDILEQEKGWLRFGSLSTWIQNDLQFDNIRNDQRFKDMIKRVLEEQAEVQEQVNLLLPLDELKD